MRIAYWILTILAVAIITLSAIPDVMVSPEAVEIFANMGYPTYLLPFLGVAKFLAVIAVLQPWFRTVKEWAYAGLVFDVIGAIYSHICVGHPAAYIIFASVALALVFGSYFTLRALESRQHTAGVV